MTRVCFRLYCGVQDLVERRKCDKRRCDGCLDVEIARLTLCVYPEEIRSCRTVLQSTAVMRMLLFRLRFVTVVILVSVVVEVQLVSLCRQ